MTVPYAKAHRKLIPPLGIEKDLRAKRTELQHCKCLRWYKNPAHAYSRKTGWPAAAENIRYSRIPNQDNTTAADSSPRTSTSGKNFRLNIPARKETHSRTGHCAGCPAAGRRRKAKYCAYSRDQADKESRRQGTGWPESSSQPGYRKDSAPPQTGDKFAAGPAGTDGPG